MTPGPQYPTFQQLVEAVGDVAIYMLDVEGRVVTWNPAASRIKGWRREEVEGQSFRRFFTPEDQAGGVPEAILSKARSEGRVESEGWRLRKDGSRFWAAASVHAIRDDGGAIIGFAKITRDMTDQRAAQEALIESERRFRYLVEGVVDYALIMLDPSGVITNWNAGAQHIKGYRADEIIGQHMSAFYTDADRAAGEPARALQTAIDQGRYEAEAWRVRKDGSLFWANVVLDAIRDEVGELRGFAKITRDITERRNAQLDLQKAHERLAQAQKMEAIGQLTGGVAHDFNNLLMVVGGQAQLLRSKIGDDPRALKALEAIEMSTRRGQSLTRQLLAFARRQRLNPRVLSLDERAANLRDLLDASISGNIALRIEIPETVWPVEVDPGELELALLNLAVNARDAMPNGGALIVSARNLVLCRGEVDAEFEGEFVAVTVRDTGFGIPPDILPRVFEPFFTTKEVNRGTGLGLSQVYGFVEQSGGRATVASELGVGTSFTLYLPRSAKAVGVVIAAPAAEAPQGARVLVVEDNPDVADVAAGLLERLGSWPQVVNSADAALRMLQAGARPDVIFSDIVMAGDMDGLALARRVRAEWPDLPILLTSGYSQNAETVVREFTILPKPYGLSDLSRALGAVLGAPADA